MKKPIRAILLAAGFGTRLRPITANKPKCLVTIGGIPILERWIRKLENIGCQSLIINTHYLADHVDEFLVNRTKSKMIINGSNERELLGTAGTLIKHKEFFKNSQGILAHADNATNEELDKLLKAHEDRPKKCIITMLTFQSNSPNQCGIVELDNQNVVIGFHEKIDNPPGNKANGAVYVFDDRLLTFIEELKEEKITDFSTQVLPKLLGRIYTWHTEKSYLDIGTPKNLLQAQRIWPHQKQIDN